MRFKAKAALGVGALILGTGIGAENAAADMLPVKFIMDWAFEGSQSIWPLADDRGCFTRAGIQVTIDRSYGSGDALTKVASGAYDVGVSDFSTLVGFDAKNPEKRLIAFFMVSDIAPMSVVTLKENGIAKPGDLAGKRIADGAAEASRINFPVFAKANHVDPQSVTWITISPDLRQQLLVQKRTDAVAGHMFTILTGLRALGVADKDVTIMKYADYGVDFYGSALMTKPAWAAAHPDAARAFAACAADGIKASRRDPAAAMTALRKHNPLIKDETELAALDFSNTIAIATPHVMKDGLSDVTPDRLQRTITQATDALGLPAPKPDEVWTAKYLPPHAELILSR